MISSWIFDVFIIYAALFLIQPIPSPSTVQCVPHPPEICITNPHFRLIYQGVLQRIFGMLSVKIGSFLTMLRCFCLLSRHSTTIVYSTYCSNVAFSGIKSSLILSVAEKHRKYVLYIQLYMYNCLLNTPQQRSSSRIFDVSYPPCQTILRCSNISAQHL